MDSQDPREALVNAADRLLGPAPKNENTGLPCEFCGERQKRLNIQRLPGDGVLVHISEQIAPGKVRREIRGICQILKSFAGGAADPVTSTNKPSRSELEDLLWGVHAAECFEQDALDILEKAEGTKTDRIAEVLSVVESELNGISMTLEGDARRDLQNLSTAARRGAILLMVAAWYAERKVPRVTKPAGDGVQANLFGGDDVANEAKKAGAS